jgi:tetrahydromethanopterin S-methyltransferase subunit G
LAEVEAYVDVAIMYALLIGLSLLALALLLPELFPR